MAIDAMSLRGRVAVVTGAAGGIGQAIVASLIDQGAHVHGLDLNATALAAMQQRWPACFTPHRVTLGDRADEDRAIAQLTEALAGRCDIVVNNAGISRVQPFVDTCDDDLDALFAINVTAALRLTRALLPLMVNRPGTNIVNIGSELALVGQWGYVAYCATKGAILAWTRALAIELAPQGIRANAVCPGPIDTPMLDAEFALADDPNAARQAEVASVPVGRLGRPADIAAVVAFLASDAAAFVNGAAWSADGGKTAR